MTNDELREQIKEYESSLNKRKETINKFVFLHSLFILKYCSGSKVYIFGVCVFDCFA